VLFWRDVSLTQAATGTLSSQLPVLNVLGFRRLTDPRPSFTSP
jgi:hypothetical protein